MKQNKLMKSTSCIVTGNTRIYCVEPQNKKIKSQITEKRLIKLHNELSSQKYKPTPSKRVGIPRSDGVLVIWVSLHKLIRLYKAQFLIN